MSFEIFYFFWDFEIFYKEEDILGFFTFPKNSGNFTLVQNKENRMDNVANFEESDNSGNGFVLQMMILGLPS